MSSARPCRCRVNPDSGAGQTVRIHPAATGPRHQRFTRSDRRRARTDRGDSFPTRPATNWLGAQPLNPSPHLPRQRLGGFRTGNRTSANARAAVLSVRSFRSRDSGSSNHLDALFQNRSDVGRWKGLRSLQAGPRCRRDSDRPPQDQLHRLTPALYGTPPSGAAIVKV